jgi:hypothetical protein
MMEPEWVDWTATRGRDYGDRAHAHRVIRPISNHNMQGG